MNPLSTRQIGYKHKYHLRTGGTIRVGKVVGMTPAARLIDVIFLEGGQIQNVVVLGHYLTTDAGLTMMPPAASVDKKALPRKTFGSPWDSSQNPDDQQNVYDPPVLAQARADALANGTDIPPHRDVYAVCAPIEGGQNLSAGWVCLGFIHPNSEVNFDVGKPLASTSPGGGGSGGPLSQFELDITGRGTMTPIQFQTPQGTLPTAAATAAPAGATPTTTGGAGEGGFILSFEQWVKANSILWALTNGLPASDWPEFTYLFPRSDFDKAFPAQPTGAGGGGTPAFSGFIILRTTGDVQSTIDYLGTTSIQHPSGARITMGENYATPGSGQDSDVRPVGNSLDLTGQDRNGNYKLRYNTQQKPSIVIEDCNGNQVLLDGPKNQIVISTVAGATITLNGGGTIDMTSAGGAEVLLNGGGTVDATSDGGAEMLLDDSATLSAGNSDGSSIEVTSDDILFNTPQFSTSLNQIISIFNTHQHPDPQGGVTGPPTTPIP